MHADESEFDRLLERARELLGAGDDGLLGEATQYINEALTLCPDSVDGWLIKCQVASATGDDIAALAAAEMALARDPQRAECLYWRGAVLGDLGRFREALRSIEAALRAVVSEDHWLLEDLFYEKVTILVALGLHDAAVGDLRARAAKVSGLGAAPGGARAGGAGAGEIVAEGVARGRLS